MIRKYSADDADTLMAIWERSNAFAHPFLSNEIVLRLAQEVRDVHLPNAEIYVLEEVGRTIGFVAMIENEVGGLFIEPTEIGKGYGKALLDYAVSLKGPLSVEVFEDNAVGRPFYERYGFVHESKYLHQPTGAVMCRMAMPHARQNL